jgi:hypothetical protein
VVTDYFVQTSGIGILNTPADNKALYIDLNHDGSLNFNRTIALMIEGRRDADVASIRTSWTKMASWVHRHHRCREPANRA